MRGDGPRDEPVWEGAVMSRRRRRDHKHVDQDTERDRKEAAAFSTDRDEVLAKRPDSRLKWLYKALVLAGKQQLKLGLVHEIVTHEKFTSDVGGKVGSQMKAMLLANSHFFSPKQQRSLQSESGPFHRFELPTKSRPAGEEEDEDAPKNGKKKKKEKKKDKKKEKGDKRKRKRKRESSTESSRRNRGSSDSESTGGNKDAKKVLPSISDAARLAAASAASARPARALDPRVFARGASDDV